VVKFKPFIAQITPIKTHFHFFADIYFYHDEDSGETDETYSETEAITNPDDLLPPIEKLEKYADSENIFNR